MTDIKFENQNENEAEYEDEYGYSPSYHGECAGCDCYEKLDDIGLCSECAAKLDRDMIRERDWERSITAFCTPKEHLETLRKKVIKKYGDALELIAPCSPPKKKKPKKKKNRHKKPK